MTNSLQDLRDTLDAHAASVHDDPTPARVAAVRGRARAVRRRRAVAGAGAAAAVVAAVALVTVLPGDRDPIPADRELIGREAPETLTSLGYTYHFAEGVESDEERATVRLDPSEEPRLVSWASDSEQAWVATNMEGWSTETRATDFDDFMLVPPGTGMRVTLRTSSDAALAVYELGDEQPAGHTVGDVTFRERVADDELLAAAIGGLAEQEVTTEVTLPEGEIRVARLCRGDIPRGYWFNVEIGDQGPMSQSGCGESGFDPGGSGGSTFRVAADEVGDTVQVRAWISRGSDGPPVAVEGVQVGFGVYDVADSGSTMAGGDVHQHVEYAGHLWLASDTRSVGFSDHSSLATVNRRDEQVLAVGHFHDVEGMVQFRHGDPGIYGENFMGGGGTGEVSVLLPPGGSARLTVERGAGKSAELGWATYVRAD